MHRLPAAATAALTDIRTGGCSAWQLPPDATCAQVARSLVRDTLTALGMPGDLTYTAMTLVSELATNAFQHAPPRTPSEATAGAALSRHGAASGLPELWLYHRRHPAPQLVITIFDTHRHWNRHPGPRAFLPESGRGLQIIAALSAAWGVHPTRPRRQVPYDIGGKAVWAALPLPGNWQPPLPITTTTTTTTATGATASGAGAIATDGTVASAARRPTPCEATNNLQELLTVRGVTRIQRADSERTCVLSLRPELTVWADACFRWRDGDARGTGGAQGTHDYLRRPLDDVIDVAEQLIHRYEELDAAFPWTTAPPTPPPWTATGAAGTTGRLPRQGTNP